MKKCNLLILCIFFGLTSSLQAQIDSTSYKQFKTFLPFILEAISSKKDSLVEKKERVQEVEYIPIWEIEKFTKNEIQDILNVLETKSDISIIKDENLGTSINIISNLQDFKITPKLKQEFRNLSIEISNFNITNQDSEDIFDDQKRNYIKPITEGVLLVRMQGAQLNTRIPIKNTFESIKGDVTLKLQEKQNYTHKIITTDDIGTKFSFKETEIECLSLNGYISMLKLNNKVDGLQIVSINENGKKHIQKVISYIPLKVYEKSLQANLTEDEIKYFADNYSYEDFSNENQSYILTYESSGNIAELHLCVANKIKVRGECKLKIDLQR